MRLLKQSKEKINVLKHDEMTRFKLDYFCLKGFLD